MAVYGQLFASCLDAGMAVAPALQAAERVLAEEVRGSRPAAPWLPGSLTDEPVTEPGARLVTQDGSRAPIHSARPSPPRDARCDQGPLHALGSVAALLSLGADPVVAWRPADDDEDLAPLAAAARRSAAGGGALADAVREHSALLRQESMASARQAAGRAGVLMTAPLGVCFLPAFLCWGLAPVIVGLLGRLDIF